MFDAIPGGIRTVAADPAKLEDPHLIIYNPVLTLNDTTIVTNGDQTDTIYRYMRDNLFPGYGFEAALATRTFEDDAPNFTPRISGVVDMRRGGYKLSILKSCDGNPASVQRQTFDYPQPVAGEGQLITTYQKNGSPIPSFAGEPLRVTLDQNDADEFAGKLWESLNEDNKVSLFVRAITLETGDYEDVILNKYNTVEAELMNEFQLKYGTNPNQKPARIFMADGSDLPVTILNGKPGYINFLDAFNSYQLVRDLKKALGQPAAASFKHVSPAGAAIGLPLDETLRKMYHISAEAELSPLACAYARARGADRMSSFGDWIALSDVCDLATAKLIQHEVSDASLPPL